MCCKFLSLLCNESWFITHIHNSWRESAQRISRDGRPPLITCYTCARGYPWIYRINHLIIYKSNLGWFSLIWVKLFNCTTLSNTHVYWIKYMVETRSRTLSVLWGPLGIKSPSPNSKVKRSNIVLCPNVVSNKVLFYYPLHTVSAL